MTRTGVVSARARVMCCMCDSLLVCKIKMVELTSGAPTMTDAAHGATAFRTAVILGAASQRTLSRAAAPPAEPSRRTQEDRSAQRTPSRPAAPPAEPSSRTQEDRSAQRAYRQAVPPVEPRARPRSPIRTYRTPDRMEVDDHYNFERTGLGRYGNYVGDATDSE